MLAHALGGGRIELSFDDPLTASLDGTAAIVIADASDEHAPLAERARAAGVATHFAGETQPSDICVEPSDAVIAETAV